MSKKIIAALVFIVIAAVIVPLCVFASTKNNTPSPSEENITETKEAIAFLGQKTEVRSQDAVISFVLPEGITIKDSGNSSEKEDNVINFSVPEAEEKFDISLLYKDAVPSGFCGTGLTVTDMKTEKGYNAECYRWWPEDFRLYIFKDFPVALSVTCDDTYYREKYAYEILTILNSIEITIN